MKRCFKLLIFLLLTFSINAQNSGLEFDLGGYLNQSDFNRINYLIQNQVNTTEKLFKTGLPIFKLSYLSEKGFVYSVNHTNYGVFSEGTETVSSKVKAVGIGIGKEFRTNSKIDLFNFITLDIGVSSELRVNYNYYHKGVKIEVTGQIANQIIVKDDIEKITPEFAIYIPRVSVGLLKADTFEVFAKLGYHLLYAEKLSNKFSTKRSFNFLKIKNTVEILSLSTGIKIKW
jgi:hypothetical protein